MSDMTVSKVAHFAGTLGRDAITIVKESLDFPMCAWETPYAAALGKRKLIRILVYLTRGERRQPKNRVYRSNRPKVNNLWDK